MGTSVLMRVMIAVLRVGYAGVPLTIDTMATEFFSLRGFEVLLYFAVPLAVSISLMAFHTLVCGSAQGCRGL